MRLLLECVSCIIRQAVEILDRLVKSDKKKQQILKKLVVLLSKQPLGRLTPPELTAIGHKFLQKAIGNKDLYAKIKQETNVFALKLYPSLEKIVKKAKDSLNMAIRLSIAGNIIDYGAHSNFSVHDAIKESIHFPFSVSHYKQFKKLLKKSKLILYIGDNAGEIVFDKLLVKQISNFAPIIFGVKSKPAINDAMIKDAKMVGMPKIAKVIKTGSDCAGTLLSKTSLEFKKIYKKADMVIAKGQGNFETLEDPKKDIFYLLKLKCPCLAKHYNLSKGGIVLWHSRSRKSY